ncbi:hypothetical protein [Chitinophaga niastensis]|uniref:hypothetical protein n=1 Tax=Chitinophaga niastensis TaxID=536980 RepID=UPI000D0CFE62|nr:hypothetical protein [Chitinophaga niastensis]
MKKTVLSGRSLSRSDMKTIAGGVNSFDRVPSAICYLPSGNALCNSHCLSLGLSGGSCNQTNYCICNFGH